MWEHGRLIVRTPVQPTSLPEAVTVTVTGPAEVIADPDEAAHYRRTLAGWTNGPHDTVLRVHPKTVTDLRLAHGTRAEVGIEPAHLSLQLAVLRRANLVRTHKEGSNGVLLADQPGRGGTAASGAHDHGPRSTAVSRELDSALRQRETVAFPFRSQARARSVRERSRGDKSSSK
ncbi:hypothetical protein M878_01575 [Streptomyces roseochromogenus subsp. oscitans DS 12.976]|uniref:Uncharacterized protein n=1 Tax=Streptomyces roseochromogenus subsp. oscitans DS 12.976 TaxID=1352936 RepID=V6KX53_STRRC|nr:hypothetical protein M878_01575 [Streptomyces roseochromogenus subsp. oscitans DS 12.976]